MHNEPTHVAKKFIKAELLLIVPCFGETQTEKPSLVKPGVAAVASGDNQSRCGLQKNPSKIRYFNYLSGTHHS